MPVRWGGAYVTCGINSIKLCFTLFLKLETVDPCGLWAYFQRYASYYAFYNVEEGIRKINMNILEKPDRWSLLH